MLPEKSSSVGAFLRQKSVTLSDFFSTVSKYQMAWLWTVLLRRGNGTAKGSNKHHAAAGHGNTLFERCNTWIMFWVKQLRDDERTFSMERALKTLRKYDLIDKKNNLDGTSDTRETEQPGRNEDVESDDEDVFHASQDPMLM